MAICPPSAGTVSVPPVRIEPARSRLFRDAHLAVANGNGSLAGDGVSVGRDAVGDGPFSRPCAAVVNVIHGTCVNAVQLHSRAVPTVRAPDPPEGPNEDGAPVTVVSHLVPDGLVTLFMVVLAELPHAAEEATRADRGRARQGPDSTSHARRNAGKSPARTADDRVPGGDFPTVLTLSAWPRAGNWFFLLFMPLHGHSWSCGGIRRGAVQVLATQDERSAGPPVRPWGRCLFR